MKKIISILAFTVLPTIAYSQLPLVEYKPVIVGKSNNNSSNEHNRGNSNGYFPNVPSYSTPNRSTAQSYQTVGAYFFDASSQNFKRTKIKINLGESYSGETEIYVRAVLDRSLYRESWRDCNNRAVRVNALLDKEIIVNNFEWKVEHTTLGTIYFKFLSIWWINLKDKRLWKFWKV